MSKLNPIFLLLIALIMSGCGLYKWAEMPLAPKYNYQETSIPLKIGIITSGKDSDNRCDSLAHPHSYELGVIKEWKKVFLFDSIVYPYIKGDSVDTVLRLEIKGLWGVWGAGGRRSPSLRGIRNGYATILPLVTLGMSVPVLGHKITGTHHATATIGQSFKEFKRYSTEVTSTIEISSGLAAGRSICDDVTPYEYLNERAEANDLQIKRIAFDLAKKIRADQRNLLSKLGKFQ